MESSNGRTQALAGKKPLILVRIQADHRRMFSTFLNILGQSRQAQVLNRSVEKDSRPSKAYI